MAVTAMVFATVSKRLPAGTERPAWAPAPIQCRGQNRKAGICASRIGRMAVWLVIDADDWIEPIATFEPGTNGFARVVLRGMAKERLEHGRKRDRQDAFRLRRNRRGWPGARRPFATGREIHLTAFGEASLAAFEHLMTAGRYRIDDRQTLEQLDR